MRVYVPQFFVSSQQRFGVMDIKAPIGTLGSWTDRAITFRQISVTAIFYLEDSRKIYLRGVRAHRPKDTKDTRRKTPQSVGASFGSSIYMFISPWACPM